MEKMLSNSGLKEQETNHIPINRIMNRLRQGHTAIQQNRHSFSQQTYPTPPPFISGMSSEKRNENKKQQNIVISIIYMTHDSYAHFHVDQCPSVRPTADIFLFFVFFHLVFWPPFFPWPSPSPFPFERQHQSNFQSNWNRILYFIHFLHERFFYFNFYSLVADVHLCHTVAHWLSFRASQYKNTYKST